MNAVESVSLPENFIELVHGTQRPIVFVIDCSNAMHGAPLDSARACCRRSLGRLLYLEIRMLVMSTCREWCLREVVFNESYETQDIPAFLRR